MADDLDEGAGTPDPPELPDWVDPKFASAENPIEAQARSYSEALRAMEESGRERNELRETVDELVQQMETFSAPVQQQPGIHDNPLVVQYANALGIAVEDAAAALSVQAQVAQAVAQENAPRPAGPDVSMLTAFAENQIRSQNSDYDTHRDATIRVLQENPQLVADTGTLDGVQRGLDTAFQIARGRALHEQSLSAEQKAQADEAARAAKMAAQGVPGNGTRPQRVNEASDVWTRIKNADVGGFKLPS